jgi:hypothetical protein
MSIGELANIVLQAENTTATGLGEPDSNTGYQFVCRKPLHPPKSSKTTAQKRHAKTAHTRQSHQVSEVYQFLRRVLVHTPRQNDGWAMSKVNMALTKS